MELKDKGTFPKDFDKGSIEGEYSQVNLILQILNNALKI